MKKIKVTINVLEKGDYVFTPRGPGIITNVLLSDGKTLRYRVTVQHKYDDEDNPSNEEIEMDGTTPLLISKLEYEKG